MHHDEKAIRSTLNRTPTNVGTAAGAASQNEASVATCSAVESPTGSASGAGLFSSSAQLPKPNIVAIGAASQSGMDSTATGSIGSESPSVIRSLKLSGTCFS